MNKRRGFLSILVLFGTILAFNGAASATGGPVITGKADIICTDDNKAIGTYNVTIGGATHYVGFDLSAGSNFTRTEIGELSVGNHSGTFVLPSWAVAGTSVNVVGFATVDGDGGNFFIGVMTVDDCSPPPTTAPPTTAPPTTAPPTTAPPTTAPPTTAPPTTAPPTTAPPTTAAPATTVATTTPPTLPATGSNNGQLTAIASLLVVAGIISLIFAARRRPS